MRGYRSDQTGWSQTAPTRRRRADQSARTRAEVSSEGSEVVRLAQRTPFTMVDNPTIRALDDYVALGLYVDMLSWPPGWRINLREMSRSHKQGRTVLTAAMNDLIERRLVFRVRFQQAGGQWMTRTYVCANPVTADELADIRTQFLGRCRIETSTALMAAANPAAAPNGHPAPATATDSPSTQFPTHGGPTPGRSTPRRRASGQPTIGTLAPQRSDPRPKIPLPSPNEPQPSAPHGQTVEEDGSDTTASRADAHPALKTSPDPRLVDALHGAWPRLTARGIAQLGPDLCSATEQIGYQRLVEHLTSNTGGANNPAAVLRARLQDLPYVRTRTVVAWCGACSSPDYRWIENEQGFPLQPCPVCSAQARTKVGS